MFVSNSLRAVLILLFASRSLAQTAENFSDGDFAANPAWIGDHAKFEVLSGELHLKAPAVSSTAYLSTPSEAVENATWEFSVRLTFNPSSTNYLSVFLMSDVADFNLSLNGYFVKIGNTADEVSLYRKKGAVETEIIDGLDGRINVDPVILRVRVTRNETGDWALYSDPGITGNYSMEGSTRDEEVLSSAHFGFLAVYTSTRSTSFYMDNIGVMGGPVTDRIPPQLDSITVLSQTAAKLWFSEHMDGVSLEEEANYILSPGSRLPGQAIIQSDGRAAELTFQNAFPNGSPVELSVQNLEDLAGNVMRDTTVSILYFQAAPLAYRDVMITEIFADPSPSVGLPPSEFVEIYNRSANPVRLTNWQLADRSSSTRLGDYILHPGSYLILAGSDGLTMYGKYGATMAIAGFPTLNNDGDMLILRTKEGRRIDSVRYHPGWYRDEDKAQGGYSIELIDLNNPCAEAENWTASESESGGTPGRVNSVNASKPDLLPPEIISVLPLNGNQLQVTFNEKLANPLRPPTILVVEDPCNPLSMSAPPVVYFANSSLRTLVVTLDTPLQPGRWYRLAMNDVEDCAGNISGVHSCPDEYFLFGLPETAAAGDLLINEILFNPRSGGVDFVELANTSSKFVNLRGFRLSNSDPSDEEGIFADRLMAPGELLALTPDVPTLISHYPLAKAGHLVMQPLPALPDEEGFLEVSGPDSTVMDRLSYHREFHSVFIRDPEGVSLERISPDDTSSLKSNWTSASAQFGYATPGERNSQELNTPEAPGEVFVYPPVFEPESGTPPYAEIVYRFSRGGWTANARVLDAGGRTVKTLTNNEVIGTEGFFRWEGDNDNGARVRMGAYVVWLEIFDASGFVQTFRERVVVSRRP